MNSPDGVIFMVIVAMMDFCYNGSSGLRSVRRAAYLKNRQIFRTKLLIFTSAIMLLTPGLSSRVVDARPTLPDANCRCDVNDRFDPQARMPQGIHQGECINSCIARSLRRLSAAEANQYGIEPQAIRDDLVILAFINYPFFLGEGKSS